MVEARFTPVVNVPAYFSIAKRQIKRFVLTYAGGDLSSVAGWTWKLLIRKNSGNQKDIILLTLGNGLSYEAYSSYTLVADFSVIQTSLEEGEYFWKLIRTDIEEDWISGPAYFSYKAPTVSWDASAALTVNIVNESLEISLVSASTVSEGTRVQNISSSATITPDVDNYDAIDVSAQSVALTINNPTGSSKNMNGFVIRVKDDGTARAVSFGPIYRAVGVTLPTTTTLGNVLYMAIVYNVNDVKWDVVAVIEQA